jgi:hypothetical protein
MRTLKERTKDLLLAVPDITELTMCPSIFSDDIDRHNCDQCPSSPEKMGDCFDSGVCLDCWQRAIDGCSA